MTNTRILIIQYQKYFISTIHSKYSGSIGVKCNDTNINICS